MRTFLNAAQGLSTNDNSNYGFFWANKLLHAVILQSQESLATTRSGFFPASFTDGWTCIPFVPAQRDPVELPPIVDLGNCELYR